MQNSNFQRTNYMQSSTSGNRRARIFDTSSSTDRKNHPSILPISNSQISKSPIQVEEFNVQGLESSQVSEIQIQDINKVNSYQKMQDLSKCKVKFIKKENKQTQTDQDYKDQIIKQQEEIIKKLQEQLNIQQFKELEFSFHKENMNQNENNFINENNINNNNPAMTNSPYKKQNKQHYFTIIPQNNSKAFILKPQNIEVAIPQEYQKQRSNKDYFFSLKE